MATRQKRGQGEGSIYKRNDGRWAASTPPVYENGKLIRKTVYGKTRSEVQGKLTDLMHKLKQGIPLGDDRQTTGQFLQSWLNEVVKPSVKPKTYQTYSDLVRLHLGPALGKRPLTKLSPQDVQRFLNSKNESKLSARTVQHLRATLSNALNTALKWGLVSRNVAELVDSPKAVRPDIKFMMPKEAKAFLQKAKKDRLGVLFTIALSMGLRRGEALGLRWEDVDFDKRIIRVRYALQRINSKLVLTELKTKTSRRDLPMIDLVYNGLKAHRKRQLKEKLALGQYWKDSGLVFTTSLGTPISPRNLVRKYHALLKSAELERRRFHDLRHSCASLLIMQGVPLKTVSDLLGHSGITITANFYAHLAMETWREAMNLMDALLAK